MLKQINSPNTASWGDWGIVMPSSVAEMAREILGSEEDDWDVTSLGYLSVNLNKATHWARRLRGESSMEESGLKAQI